MMAGESEDHGTASIKAEPKSSSDTEHIEPAYVCVKIEPYDVEVIVCPADSDRTEVNVKIEPTEGYEYPTGVSPVKVDPADVAEDVRTPVAAKVKKELDIELTVFPPPDKKLQRPNSADTALQANSVEISRHQLTHNTAGDQKDMKSPQNKQPPANTEHNTNSNSSPSISNGQHSCNICGKSYKTKSHINRHMQIHTNDRPYSCDVCCKFYLRKCTLAMHLKFHHTGERPHYCNVCGKVFTTRYCLARHMLIHTSEPQHNCNVCGKRFTLKSNLNRHLRLHTGELPHKCDVCSKGYPSKSGLARHVMIHTGLYPHSCTICRKRFNVKSNLTRHLMTHSGEQYRFSCDACSKRFTKKSTIIKHLKNHA